MMSTRSWRAITASTSAAKTWLAAGVPSRQLKMVGTIFDVMNMFLGAVGIVTLAIGAIGVINIMLVSVSERTHEIGLRKAVGATNRSILFQFLLEGIFLTLASGLVGMGLATVLMAVLGTVHGPEGFDPPKL